nr:uncharacterized protein LOC107438112 [Parasteatoda tepidariorum]
MARLISGNTGSKSLQPSHNVFRFKWIIQNYSFCFRNTNSALISPSFKVSGINGMKWNLNLYPKQEDESAKFVGLYLQEDRKDETIKDRTEFSEWKREFKFDVKLDLIATSGILIKTRIYHDLEFKNQWDFFVWGSSHFAKIEDIEKDAKSSSEDVLTICCYVSSKNFVTPILTGYLCRTTICVDRLTSRFNLQFTLGRLNITRQKLNFPKIANFEMVIYETNVLMSDETDLRIDIYYDKSKVEDCKGYIVDCKLTMQDGTSVICFERAKHCFDHFPSTWSFPSGVFSCELQNFRDNYVEDKKFVLFCDVMCSTNKQTHFTTTESISNDINNSIANDANNHPTLKGEILKSECKVENKNCYDTKLVVNNQVDEDHKALSFTESPVSEVKFKQRIQEVIAGIGNWNSFLENLCTNEMKSNEKKIECEQVIALFTAADKCCELSLSLKQKCLASLKSEICEENVCELLSLVQEDIELKSTAMNFILANSDKILSSPQWLLWLKNNMELASDVVSKISANLRASQIAGQAFSSKSDGHEKKRRLA